MDTGTYSSNWSVFYTGATQIAEIRKNAFGALGGFLGKIVVKTRGLLQPCTGCYTQFWHILAKQRAKAADFSHTIRLIIVLEHCPQKTTQTHGQKQLKKGEKNVLHTRRARQKYTGKSPGFLHVTQYYDNLQKMLDFCDFLI